MDEIVVEDPSEKENEFGILRASETYEFQETTETTDFLGPVEWRVKSTKSIFPQYNHTRYFIYSKVTLYSQNLSYYM